MKHAAMDNLYEYFERHLFETEFDQGESQEEFVSKVVKDYFNDLLQVGQVCSQHLEIIKTDLEEEVTEMLQKKIYGFFSLKHYRTWASNKKEV
jgi:hypothetical protein